MIWAENNLECRHYASVVRAPHHNKISLGQGNDNTNVVFDTNTTERSSKDIQPNNVNLSEMCFSIQYVMAKGKTKWRNPRLALYDM